jgi:hypothetical protein
MSQAIQRLLTLPSEERRRILKELSYEERQLLGTFVEQKLTNPYSKYEEDPVNFVEQALDERVWSKQREILNSVRDHKRTAVPACHAPGKSHIAARAVAWWISIHPPGTAQVVTTATTFRQVRNILWPHIRKVVNRHKLPGEVNTVDWKIDGEIVAYGFSSANHDETSVQGIHAPHLLVVVDEAGGISQTLGTALESLMTGGHTRLLLLGNPPTDQEGGWFERACNSDLYNVIPIGAYDTPNFTGEDAGTCKSCPANVPPHPVASHLVDQLWVDEVTREFGEDSAFVEARVHARFPRSVSNKVIPFSWIEQSQDNPLAQTGAIRLGVDIAADGGDEFVIAWADGMETTVRHKTSGKANANAVDVAGVILNQIREAEEMHKQRQISDQVRVKIDAIGVGWGVASTLKRWGDEQMHSAKIVAVNVAEKARDSNRFTNQRAEMWWNARTLLQPQGDGSQQVKIIADQRTMAQMAGPQYLSDSSGRIKIESKAYMKRRGVGSPDRAEAMLLALYDPPGSTSIDGIAPLSFTQPNQWGF